MKKIILLCAGIVLLLGSCGKSEKKVYIPSKFPKETKKEGYKIPYKRINGSISVDVKLNGTATFPGVWDSGCGFPLQISSTEAITLVKNGVFSDKDYIASYKMTVADGSAVYEPVYMLKEVSFTDEAGQEYKVQNVPCVVAENPSAPILIGLPIMKELGVSYEDIQTEDVILIRE